MRPNIQENEMTSVNAKQEALLDELLKDYTNPQDILGEHGLLKRLTQRVVERILEAELTAHLGYAPHEQHLQNTRRNTLPVKLVDGALLMCHKYLACALVEQMEIGKTSSGSDRVLHHPPEAFDGVQVVTTMGR